MMNWKKMNENEKNQQYFIIGNKEIILAMALA